MPQIDNKEFLILYDGVCLFCEGWVNFVINRLPESVHVQFIPLQQITLTPELQLRIDRLGERSKESIVCITSDQEVFLKSDASLTMMSHLNNPYPFFSRVMLFIPLLFRNFVYDLIGKRRYKIWGKKDVCILPIGDRKQFFVSKDVELMSSFQSNYNNFFSFSEIPNTSSD